jgi:hypothetical protein
LVRRCQGKDQQDQTAATEFGIKYLLGQASERMRILASALAVYIHCCLAYLFRNEAEPFDVSDDDLHHGHRFEAAALATEGVYSVGYPRWHFNMY